VSNDFSAYKAMAVGIALMVAGVVLAPSLTNGQFDMLRITKTVGGKKGHATTTTTTTTDPFTSTSGGTTTTTTSTNSFYSELSMVPSNFDINTELVPSWGTGAIPASGAPDVVGAFRFICNAGQLRYDDPIVFPGQPGKSHLHQFYGNTSADANSTYESLRSAGSSTCMSPLNRSAYWMPAMLDGRGNVVRPDFVSIYYKRRPITDPKCSLSSGDPAAEGNCVPLPNGLKFVFGYNMLNPAQLPTGSLYFNCQGPGSTPGTYPDIVTAAKYCPAGAQLGAIIKAPECWDGKNLDSADHRSHVSYASYNNSGYLKCPTTHPYVIPTFTLGAWYTVDSSLDRSGVWEAGKTVTWSLSSDSMAGMAPSRPGTTFHADWFGAWDNTVMSMWMDNCINKLLNCSGGDLGNGKQMRQFSGFSWLASPRLVPVPQA
jgi:hypothetical protein